MDRVNVAIKSDHVITPQGVRKAFVLIANDRIADVVTELPHSDIPVLDMSTNVVMAGIVDPHVHINEPGRTNWEGFDTAGKAALAGGITTVVDMPLNSSPVTVNTDAFDLKLQSAKHPHMNCGFWGGIIPGNTDDIEPLISRGVLGFKAFLTHSGIDEFPNVTEQDLRKAMPLIAAAELPLLVHCELSDPLTFQPQSTRNYNEYLSSRPKSWEDNAIALMIRLCREFNCRTHIVHLSSSNAIAQIMLVKKEGLPITVETGQHYLYFNAEEISDGQTAFKCAPPIRDRNNNELLWKALQEGIIDFVATDHSPAPRELKALDSGDFMKAWGGIASLQFSLPVLWTAARNRNIKIEKMAEWLCENSAILPGLQNRKGKVQKGFDADLTIWNSDQSFTVVPDMIHHKHKVTPYLDQELYGVVKQTWLAGKCVYADGKFLHLNSGQILTGRT